MEYMEKLRQLMHEGIVEFQYTKKDGTTRTAIGTLNESFIEENGGTPKGTGEAPAGTFPYWDVEAEGWRSFKNENFVEII